MHPVIARFDASLDAFVAFLSTVVAEAFVPIVFARDVGPTAGYVSRTLSAHVLAFPEEVYLARFGTMAIQGPFSDYRGGGTTFAPERFEDPYCAFANEGLGREVLAVSGQLLDRHGPVRGHRDWVSAEVGRTGFFTGYASVAQHASGRVKPCRSWSDAAEDALRRRVRRTIAGLVPEGVGAEVLLRSSAFEPGLSSLFTFDEAYDAGVARLTRRWPRGETPVRGREVPET